MWIIIINNTKLDTWWWYACTKQKNGTRPSFFPTCCGHCHFPDRISRSRHYLLHWSAVIMSHLQLSVNVNIQKIVRWSTFWSSAGVIKRCLGTRLPFISAALRISLQASSYLSLEINQTVDSGRILYNLINNHECHFKIWFKRCVPVYGYWQEHRYADDK